MNLRKNSQLTVVNNLPCTMPCTSVSMCIAHASGVHKAGVGTTGLVVMFSSCCVLASTVERLPYSLLSCQLSAVFSTWVSTQLRQIHVAKAKPHCQEMFSPPFSPEGMLCNVWRLRNLRLAYHTDIRM